MGDFRKLRVWSKAKNLAVYIYNLAGNSSFSKDFGLRDQIRRAFVSISSNIAEGDELDTDKQSVRHFYIAKGSSAELQSQVEIALEIKYVERKEYEHVYNECKSISSMLHRLIQRRISPQSLNIKP